MMNGRYFRARIAGALAHHPHPKEVAALIEQAARHAADRR
jgi:hypothetical protein